MKSILIGTLLVGLLFPCQSTVGQMVSIDHVDGLNEGNEFEIIADGQTVITFFIRITGDGNAYMSIFNGFRIYSENGATWGNTTGDDLGYFFIDHFDLVYSIDTFNINGMGADTIGFQAAAMNWAGLPAGFDDVVYKIEIGPIDAGNHNRTICIDSSFFGPAVPWGWYHPSVIPDWSGLKCFTCIDTTLTDVFENRLSGIPDGYRLYQNYPNPFNLSTVISYTIKSRSNVVILIYNILGQKIKTLVNKEHGIGNYSVTWNGTNDNGNKVAADIYFYRLQTDDYSEAKKMILLK